MRPRRIVLLSAAFLVLAAGPATALSITAQSHRIGRYQNFTYEPMRIVFDASLDTGTVNALTVFVEYAEDDSVTVPLSFSFDTTNVSNDTLVIDPATANGRWPFARRLRLQMTSAVESTGDSPFDGSYPFDDVFAANIPNDMDILQAWDPGDPFNFVDAFANANVLVGYNPVDPENTDPARTEKIPGMSATEAWKVTGGQPQIIIAVVDDGIEKYHYDELEENYFIHRGELPEPTVSGTPCFPDAYDCNGDGKFNVRDYDDDPAFAGLGHAVTIPDLFATFEDSVDNDGNGFVDDISGWDFFRDANEALGVVDFPEGGHGEDRARDAVGIGDNGEDDKPGFCPYCTMLPVRISDSVMTEANMLAAGVVYAHEMGAQVAVFASESLNQSGEINRLFTEISEAGTTLIGVASDEDSYHHAYPGAFDDILNVKAILPIPPIEFLDFLPMQIFGFTESYCTMWGEHVHVAGSSGACSSEAAGNVAGLVGLIYSRALELGLSVSANEVKQIVTMSADDIARFCLTWTGGGCQPGWDAHFGYGRPNARAALDMLGDAELGVPQHIPAEVKFRAPAWYTVADPEETPTIDVDAYMFARDREFDWQLQVAVGKEPLDGAFETVASGSGQDAIDGPIASVDISALLDPATYESSPETSFDFTVTLRLRASYNQPGIGVVRGEDRRTLAIHRDQDDAHGLLPGFPMDLDASGRSSVTFYDLDGDTDGRLEMIVAASGSQSVMVFKQNLATDAWEMMDGFPIDIMEYNGLDFPSDVTLSTPAVADLFGDGEPAIVIATYAGAVLAIHRNGKAHLDEGGDPAPLLPGFPVWANEPDNATTDDFGHGRVFNTSPVLADLDNDGMLEIVAGSYDGRVYAWKPVDADEDGRADPMPGFPVLLKSDPGAVRPAAECVREDSVFDPQIITTPAVGIFDPDSANEDIAEYPSILVGTSEVCEDGLIGLKGTRFYAVFHDGYENASGSPFLPGFPVPILGPVSDLLPLPPVTIGITSSPAVARHDGKTWIGVGSAIWFPQMLEWDNGDIEVHTLSASGFNALAHGAFGRMDGDDVPEYVLPLSSVFDIIDGWISLLRPVLAAWSLSDIGGQVFESEQRDSNWYVNPVIADISGDGRAEAISGTGGFTVDAVDFDGAQPPTWPKFTNQWSASSPSIGDTDLDGKLEVYQYTLEGWLWGWKSAGDACAETGIASDWWSFHHDERNTGFWNVDTLPPSVATNIEVEETDSGYRLSFTAPGDDWMCGTAAEYDIRVATSQEDLEGVEAFTQATAVPGIPSPAPGGTTVQIEFDSDEPEFWFAIRSVDELGHHSLISVPQTVNTNPTDDDTGDDDSTGDDDAGDDDTAPNGGDDDDDDDGCGC
ncbi:MAG: hypothetical protein IT350_05020 [Deltaproteobacteria bacterium]|nr:hypothetical protein [Deltaproteobacteria bacterium]